MANPTSNFNWQMPTPTDLVTDLPADFEVFGQAVDSSMADLLGGTTGQILAKNSNTNMDFVWITNDVGDITAVTAGTGISGGGTSGAVTITNSMATEIAAKGDLIAGTGSQTFDNVTVGSNFAFLQADSGASTGIKWNNDAWTSWTPVITASSGTFTTTSTQLAKYIRIGKICIAKFQITMSNIGTAAGNVEITLPINSINDGLDMCVGTFRENNITGKLGQIRIFGSTNMICNSYDNVSLIATNARYAGTIVYEVA